MKGVLDVTVTDTLYDLRLTLGLAIFKKQNMIC